MKKIVLLFFALCFGANTSNAQIKFIKYKRYLIPISVSKICSKPKVIVSSDIRPLDTGEDDDVQAMVHYLVSSYRFETVGLISSPGGGTGTKDTINWVIDNFEKDRAGLIGSTGRDYPTAAALKSVVVQGNNDVSNPQGISGNPGEANKVPKYDSSNSNHQGAKLIRDEVSKIINDNACGPIYILTWGGVSDVAIALNGDDAVEPISNAEVADNVRVFSIGASNTPTETTNPQSRFWNFLEENYLDNDQLWMIHSDVTFRGVYINTPQTQRVALKDKIDSFGCLGWVFSQTDTFSIEGLPFKMGDSSSVLYLMNGDASQPLDPSWGGRYKLYSSNHTKYWVDIDRVNESISRSTITPLGVVETNSALANYGVPTPLNSIYGAWYEDMRRANGTSCVAP